MKALVVSSIILVFLIGCSTSARISEAGPGVSSYSSIKRELTIEYNTPYEQVWQAINKALKDLSIEIEESKKDQLTGKITAHLASGSKVVISAKNKPSDVTEVRIKVGRLGDQDSSYLIKKAIDRNLTSKTAE